VDLTFASCPSHSLSFASKQAAHVVTTLRGNGKAPARWSYITSLVLCFGCWPTYRGVLERGKHPSRH